MEIKIGLSEHDRVDLKESRLKPSHRGFRPYLIIWQSELEFMAGLAFETGCIETGGEVYGLQTHAGRLVILLATPAGPNAIHETARFQQDIEFFRKTNLLLMNQFANQYNGNWHVHHVLSIKGLSGGDIRSLHSIASKNEYRRLCQFVLTFERDPAIHTHFNDYHGYARESHSESAGSTAWGKGFPAKRRARLGTQFAPSRKSPIFIGVHSFFYSDARHDQPVRCPIKVIPGISPIRRVLDERHPMLGLGRTPTFPISRILYESVEPESDDKRNEGFPTRLHRQFIRLPLRVQDEATVQYSEGLIMFLLPTRQGAGKIIVAHSREPPHPVVAAYYNDSEHSRRPVDLTETAVCHGKFTTLATVYKRAVRSLEMGRPLEAGEGFTGEWEYQFGRSA